MGKRHRLMGLCIHTEKDLRGFDSGLHEFPAAPGAAQSVNSTGPSISALNPRFPNTDVRELTTKSPPSFPIPYRSPTDASAAPDCAHRTPPPERAGWCVASQPPGGRRTETHAVFFCRPYSERIRSTLRMPIGRPLCVILCAMTCAGESGSKNRRWITCRTTSSVRRYFVLGPRFPLARAIAPFCSRA